MGVVAFEKQLKTAAVHSAVDYGKSQHKQVLQEKDQSLAALKETMQKLEMDAELASKQVVEIRRDYSRKWLLRKWRGGSGHNAPKRFLNANSLAYHSPGFLRRWLSCWV